MIRLSSPSLHKDEHQQVSATVLQERLGTMITFGCSESKRGVVADATKYKDLSGFESENDSESD